MTESNRSKAIFVKAAQAEIDMLRALAVAAGVSASDVVRMQIREQYQAKFGKHTPQQR